MIDGVSHIGIAVRSIEKALQFYRDTLGLSVFSIEDVESEGVRVAILLVGETRIELLEPLNEKSSLHKTLAKRGEGVHHLAFRTKNVASTARKLSELGVKILGEPRPGAGGSRVTFIHPESAHGLLLELCEES